MKDYFEQITKYYKPSVPIEEPNLFFGRSKEHTRLYKTLTVPGRNAIIFGQRGVGKTSLINIVTKHYSEKNKFKIVRHSCSPTDNFDTVFISILNQIKKNKKKSIHLNLIKIFKRNTPINLNTNYIYEKFKNEKYIIVLDEFDRLGNNVSITKFVDTIKLFSDRNSMSKFIVAGVGLSIGDLISEHESIIRNIRSVPVSLMKNKHLKEIIDYGNERLQVQFSPELINKIIWLSNGLPYFTHLLCEIIMDRAFYNELNKVNTDYLFSVIDSCMEDLQELGINHNYEEAIGLYKKFAHRVTFIQKTNYDTKTLKTVLDILSMTNPESNSQIEDVQLIYKKNGFVELEEVDIELILDELSRNSNLIVKTNNKFIFKNAFDKTYVRLESLKYLKD